MPNDFTASESYSSAPIGVGDPKPDVDLPASEFLCPVLSNDWVNPEYKLIVLQAPEKALTAKPGQFFQLLCPTPDGAEVWTRRPMSIYGTYPETGELKFLYKVVGRGTQGVATLEAGDKFNVAGPFGHGFSLDPAWKNVVVIGRGVGLATMAPISQLAAAEGAHVTAVLSARNPDLLMVDGLFEEIGADVIPVLDSDGTSDVENVEKILEGLIADGKVDAFYTCGSERLLKLCQRLGAKHDIPGEVAMEQVMACGVGPCYICVRTFVVDGEQVLKRVCREGPVFNIQEATGW